MPLRPPSVFWKNQRELDQWARSVEVKPDPGSVNDDSFAPRGALSVIGRASSTDGPPTDITATTDNTALQRISGALVWQPMSASRVTFTPTGGISATFVDAALAELDSEKAGIADAETISGLWDFTTAPTISGNTIWHSGNDGAGSTLDADLLDGQQGSFYQNASNLNTGSIPDARVPESAVTQHEAALTIAESQITDGSILARVAENETITGSWTFSSGQFTAFGIGTTATQQSAIADTSGATLTDVEAEVNKIKAVLRAFGLIAT